MTDSAKKLEDAYGRLIDHWRAPEKLRISEWAEKHMVLGEISSDPGRFKPLPTQIPMMDVFCEPAVETISVKKSARSGYTTVLDCVIGYHIAHDSCNQLMVQPTIEDGEGWSKDELSPLIQGIPALSKLVSDKRDSANTILKKRYPGGRLHIVGANSPRGFRRITVRIVYFDEVDGYPPTAGPEGDQIRLGTMRSDTFWNRKIAIGSTPTLDGYSRIQTSFEKSSKGVLMVPCLDCGEFHMRLFRKPAESVLIRGEPVPVSFIDWEKDKPETAKWVCPSCGSVFGHDRHKEMMDECKWHGENWSWDKKNGFTFLEGFSGHIGFRIWAGYGFSPNATPEKMVRTFLDVKNDPEELKTFINTVLGEEWTEPGEELSSSLLKKRCEIYDAEVPAGVWLLTLGADIQKDRIECEVVGWGKKEESWSIDYFIIPGNPNESEIWDDLEEVLSGQWSDKNGRKFSIGQACIDEGYLTSKVRAFVGKIGLHCHSMKGMDGAGRPIVETAEDRVRRLRKKRKKGVRPELLGTFEAKVTHYRRLSVDEPGPGYCHFPIGRDDEYFNQMTAEKLVPRYKKGRPFPEFIKMRERNEAQDVRLLAMAALNLYGIEKLKPRKIVSDKSEKPAEKPLKNKKRTSGFSREEWNL